MIFLFLAEKSVNKNKNDPKYIFDTITYMTQNGRAFTLSLNLIVHFAIFMYNTKIGITTNLSQDSEPF